jgi:hypothetical protein
MSVKVVYYQYHVRDIDDMDTVEEAIRYLQYGIDHNMLSPCGIYDQETNTILVPDTEGLTDADELARYLGVTGYKWGTYPLLGDDI